MRGTWNRTKSNKEDHEVKVVAKLGTSWLLANQDGRRVTQNRVCTRVKGDTGRS